MFSTKLYTSDWEIDARLARFGATRSELVEAAQLTHAARSDSVEADPLSGPGLLSYIYGTRHLRRTFCPKGWMVDRHENVEAVRDANSGMRIVFQNVDLACSPMHSPKAISGKGTAAERMVSAGQGRLFGIGEIPEIFMPPRTGALNKEVWYYCMSFDGDSFRAELSLPALISGKNFSGFIERIFIAGEPDNDLGGRLPVNDSPAEFEPVIIRK